MLFRVTHRQKRDAEARGGEKRDCFGNEKARFTTKILRERGTSKGLGVRKGSRSQKIRVISEKAENKNPSPRGEGFSIFGSGGWIRTSDLRVMSPTSFLPAPPRAVFTSVEIIPQGQRKINPCTVQV